MIGSGKPKQRNVAASRGRLRPFAQKYARQPYCNATRPTQENTHLIDTSLTRKKQHLFLDFLQTMDHRPI